MSGWIGERERDTAMAKKIDLKSMDWTSVLIDAAMQTRRSYEDSRDGGGLGPQLREVIRTYQSENGDDIDDDDDDDDDDIDPDSELDDPAPDTTKSTERTPSAGQENDSELVSLRQEVAVLRERLAASEDRLEIENARVQSTRRESSAREAHFVAREQELMRLLGDAIRNRSGVQARPEEAKPAATSQTMDAVAEIEVEVEVDTAGDIGTDTLEGIFDVESDAVADSVEGSAEGNVEAEVDDESDVEAGDDIDSKPEVDTEGTDQIIDSSKIIEVEVVIPASDVGIPASVCPAQLPAETLDDSTPSGPSSSPSSGIDDESQPLQLDDELLQTDPLGRAEAALQRGDYADARKIFAALENKSRDLGPEGELALITIRRGLAESCVGLRDLRCALRASKQARTAASARLKEAPVATSLRDYLSSTRVRGMVLLANWEFRGARRLLQRACTKAALSGIALSRDHENELQVMFDLIKGIQSAKEFKKTRKSGKRRRGRAGR